MLSIVEFIQDGSGGRSLAWGAKYKFPDGLGVHDLSANARTLWLFFYNAAADEYYCLARSLPADSGIVVHTGATPTLVPGKINVLASTVTGNVTVPANTAFAGAANAITVKLDNLTGGTTLVRSGSDTLNGGTSYVITEVYGQAVIVSRGTTALLVSPGLT